MKPTDWIVIAVITLIIGGAVAYIVKAKKSGKKCIGCPDSSSCCQKNACHCCSSQCNEKQNSKQQ
ncbi:MAG: FeoB-associated Cys-rich membrane protein [Ruminococcaceae bacterium]|nr:FeoB-associated Cys-rich membrane protein [Oscillospiraceae bacterium]